MIFELVDMALTTAIDLLLYYYKYTSRSCLNPRDSFSPFRHSCSQRRKTQTSAGESEFMIKCTLNSNLKARSTRKSETVVLQF